MNGAAPSVARGILEVHGVAPSEVRAQPAGCCEDRQELSHGALHRGLGGTLLGNRSQTIAYCATPHTVTGHTPFSLVIGQEVVLPLSRGRHEPALCPLGVTWLEALWRCCVEVIKAHELAADEKARAQTSETSRLRPENYVAFRLTKAERQAEGKFSPLFKGPYVIVNVKPAGATADIRCLATEHMAAVNGCRRKSNHV